MFSSRRIQSVEYVPDNFPLLLKEGKLLYAVSHPSPKALVDYDTPRNDYYCCFCLKKSWPMILIGKNIQFSPT